MGVEVRNPDNYSGKYFYRPPRARWNEPWQEEVFEGKKKELKSRPVLPR
jgi:type I restriction enzyme M protein